MHSLKTVVNTSNSLLTATNVLNHWWSFSSTPAYDQSSALNFVEIEKIFSLQETMCCYKKKQASPFDPTKLAIHSILRPEDDLSSNCGQNFKKTVSFDDIVPFIDEENIVTYVDFDSGITFYPETPIKVIQINRERKYISRSCEKPKCIPSNNQHNCFIDEQYNSNIFLNRYNLWDMVRAALMSFNHTNDRYSMSTISTLNHQVTNLEQTHIRCSLQCERWTVKGRDCASALHSFNEITYQRDEWTKQLLMLKSWVISGNPEHWMEFRRLWWTLIVFKCRYFFSCLISVVCLSKIYCFFWKPALVLFLWWLSVRSKSSSATSM